MKAKKIVPIILLAAVVVAAAVAWSRYSKREDPNRIRLSGNIELTQVDIAFKVPGRLTERTVDEGDSVKQGQLIARIDRDIQESQRSRDAAGLLSAETQLPQLMTAIAYQRQTIKDDHDLKVADLQQAQTQLDKLLAGSRPQEVQYARAQVEDAQSLAVQTKADWERAQTLFKNDDISRAQYDQFRARFDSAAATLKRAQENSALVVEGPRKEDIAAARAQVARAKAALQLSEAQALDLKRREQELATRKAEVERARAQMKISDFQLADTFAYTPVTGVVLSKSADPGEILAAGTTVVSIGDLDHPWLRGYIREQDLGRVKLGQKARITTDSYPGKEYWGKVSFINSEAEFTPKQIQTPEERVKLVYRIKIEVDNQRHELKSNMPVDAEIVLNQ
jgi:HlyD family secretion protein